MSEQEIIFHFLVLLPQHACSLTLEHNRHKDYYQSASEWWTEELARHGEDAWNWPSDEARQRAIDTDEVWLLQWYPHTPIGSYSIAAPTLAELLAHAATCKE
jgi:hypothetical protein